MRNIVIAGASAAGLNAAAQLRRSGFDGSITMLDRAAGRPYRRPEVSKGILEGTLDRAKIAVPWPDGLELELVDQVEIVTADLERSTLTLAGHPTITELPYDGLIVTTGAQSRPSPFPPIAGVHSLRTIEDADTMRPELLAARHIVILGGGFIGMEVAAVCRSLDKPVTVIEATDMPLGRVLGDEFSAHLTRLHTERGVRIRTNLFVTEIHSGPDGRANSLSLSDGETIEADLVLVAIGSIPAAEWLANAGLDVTAGVLCDATCAVIGTKNVVAAGDVASWINPLYDLRMRVEHWTNAVEQGMYAAKRLLGLHDPAGFSSAPYFWSDQYGMRIQSVGTTLGYDEAVVFESEGDRFLIGYGKQGKLRAVAGMGAGAAVTKLRRLVSDGADLAVAQARAAELTAARLAASAAVAASG